MKYNIKATNIELTDEIRSHIDEKIKSISKLVDPNDTSAYADVEVGRTTKHHRSGDIFRAEINMKFAGAHIYAESRKEDIHSALDEVKNEVMRGLRKEKTKRKDEVRRDAKGLKSMFRRFMS